MIQGGEKIFRGAVALLLSTPMGRSGVEPMLKFCRQGGRKSIYRDLCGHLLWTAPWP